MSRIFALIVDRRHLALTQQCIAVARQEDRRHQVLEHRPVPRQDGRLALQSGYRAAESVPVLDRNVVFRNGKKTGEPRLCRQQVIVAVVHLSDAVVVADVKQADLGVVEEFEVHAIGQRVASLSQIPKVLCQLLLPSGTLLQRLLKRLEPVQVIGRRRGVAYGSRNIAPTLVNGP